MVLYKGITGSDLFLRKVILVAIWSMDGEVGRKEAEKTKQISFIVKARKCIFELNH